MVGWLHSTGIMAEAQGRRKLLKSWFLQSKGQGKSPREKGRKSDTVLKVAPHDLLPPRRRHLLATHATLDSPTHEITHHFTI